MKKQLALKLMLPVACLILIGATIVGWLLAHNVEESIVDRATSDVTSRLTSLDETMRVARDLGVEKVKISLGIMKNSAGALGAASRSGSTHVGAETVPNLFLGGRPQANDFTLVDRTAGIAGGTATVFVRRGNDFVRISTNVKKQDGSRAIGTLLDPKGKAIAAILRNEPFYGVVDILGSPFITGYEPITSGEGTIGIWYAGYPVTALNELKESVEKFRPLGVGFAALLDGKGNVLFHGKGVTPERVVAIAGQGADSAAWVVQRVKVESWGYTLLGAYPQSAVAGEVWAAKVGVVLGALLVVALLMGALWLLVRRIISAPLADVAARMEQADLSARFDSTRHDEIGRLLTAFDRFIASVRDILIEVSQASNSVASASTEISSSAEQMASGAQEQTAQTAGVASAVEEMTKTIGENSANALSVAEVARREKAAAENGGEVVRETVAGMKNIAAAVSRATGIVSALGKSSEQISAIVQVINDIADQTNLLALNAAIEAARAGEQGRGFAVVADEVRKLAERTTKATKEIGGMITTIQQSTADAVAAMDQGNGQVKQGLTLADRAGDSLSEIVRQSQELLDKITQIAAAIEQQSATAGEIATNTEGIRKVSEETALGTRQMAKAADDLNRLTESLQQRLSKVKLAATEETGPKSPDPARGTASHPSSNVAVGSKGQLVLHPAHVA